MSAYYNEIDPAAAQWLRNLISAGLIAPGDVDERSIEDVIPGDLAGYTQCHFFAGIGVWSYALRRAGWPDDRPVWTGSCPCQPFSSAGQGAGFADERHLWPAMFHLIEQCKPATVFGEQVASKDADPWIDLVQTDLEALGYAFGAVPFPSAGVGAPHIRDRLYWVADSDSEQRHGGRGIRAARGIEYTDGSSAGGLADANGGKQQGQPVIRGIECHRENAGRPQGISEPESYGDICGLANAKSEGPPHRGSRTAQPIIAAPHGSGSATTAGPTNGFWRAADWLLCRDGKWRPVEPGTFPLAHGAPARVVRLRAYGNAINAEAAREFIGSVMECIG